METKTGLPKSLLVFSVVVVIISFVLYKIGFSTSKCIFDEDGLLPLCYSMPQYLYIKWINEVGFFLNDNFGITIGLDMEEIRSKIERIYRNPEFDEQVFPGYLHQLEGYKALSDALKTSKNISLASRFTLKDQRLNSLKSQAGVYDFHFKYQNTKNIEITRPLFILGLHRAGTTFLHRLLAKDPGANVLPFWYTLANPVTNKTRDDFINEAKMIFKAGNFVSPNFFGKLARRHTMKPDLPEEELAHLIISSPLMDMPRNFLFPRSSPVFQGLMVGENSDAHRYAYRYLKRVLQMWSSENNHLREKPNFAYWLLKAPMHSMFINYLLSEFPDAQLVFLHRNFEDALISFISLLIMFQAPIESERFDIREFALTVRDFCRGMVRKIVKYTEENPNGNYIHIKFNELMDNPLQVVKKIYSRFGKELRKNVEGDIISQLNSNPAKYPKSSLTLENFGLTKDDLNLEDIIAYDAMFGVAK